MEFRILGSVQAVDGGHELPIGGAKAKALLALLLLRPNRAVPEDVLIEALWGDAATRKAADNLHVLVSRLRKALDGGRVVRDGGGYLIRVADDELDLSRFEALRSEGRTRDALNLWRGPPLADFTYEPWASMEIQRLEELRLAALEERIDADLRAGRHAEVVGELRALVREHPLCEELRRQLILALYRCGRQAEALEAYRDARIMLVEELGLEPSPALRELEQAVLRQDPELDAPSRTATLIPVGTRRRGTLTVVAAAVLAFAGALGAIALVERGGDDGRAAAARPIGASTTRGDGPRPIRSRMLTTRIVYVRQRSQHERGSLTRSPASARVEQRPAPPPPPSVSRRRVAVRTQPRSVSPPPSNPAPKPKAVPERFVENFNDGLRNGAFWHQVSTGTGVTLAETNGRLEVEFAADGVAGGEFNVLGAHYGTQCRFLGDFDARVDFELLDWPAQNGVVVQLNAWFARRGGISVGRQSQAWDEEYMTWADPTGNSRPSVDTRGSLRIRRVGDIISTHYRSGRQWLSLGAVQTDAAPMLAIQAMTTNEWFADKPVRLAFDNFVLVADQPVC